MNTDELHIFKAEIDNKGKCYLSNDISLCKQANKNNCDFTGETCLSTKNIVDDWLDKEE